MSTTPKYPEVIKRVVKPSESVESEFSADGRVSAEPASNLVCAEIYGRHNDEPKDELPHKFRGLDEFYEVFGDYGVLVGVSSHVKVSGYKAVVCHDPTDTKFISESRSFGYKVFVVKDDYNPDSLVRVEEKLIRFLKAVDRKQRHTGYREYKRERRDDEFTMDYITRYVEGGFQTKEHRLICRKYIAGLTYRALKDWLKAKHDIKRSLKYLKSVVDLYREKVDTQKDINRTRQTQLAAKYGEDYWKMHRQRGLSKMTDFSKFFGDPNQLLDRLKEGGKVKR